MSDLKIVDAEKLKLCDYTPPRELRVYREPADGKLPTEYCAYSSYDELALDVWRMKDRIAELEAENKELRDTIYEYKHDDKPDAMEN